IRDAAASRARSGGAGRPGVSSRTADGMASRHRSARIEPTFDAPANKVGATGFLVDEEDRVMPAARGRSAARKRKAPARAPARRAAPARRRRGRAGRRRGGLFALLRGMVYWGVVLGI